MNRQALRGHILLVDKEHGWLAFAHKVLTRSGYIVETAENAIRAQNTLIAKDIDLVLIDLKAAEQEEAVIRQIMMRQSAKHYHVVIAFPTDLTPSKMRAMFKMGAYDCVDKQYDDAGLLRLIQTQLAELTRSASTQEE